jgi:MFS family permease
MTSEPSFLATRRGKLTLALLCGVAFLDFVDASIVNVALPSIRRALHFSVQDLQWVHGSFVTDLLPGMVVISISFGPLFVAVTTAANAGVPADKAGLAASLLNASQQLGGALGLAIFSALSTSRAHHLLAAHATLAHAETSGFQRALFTGSVFILASAVIALRATNTRGPTEEGRPGSAAGVADPEAVIVAA